MGVSHVIILALVAIIVSNTEAASIEMVIYVKEISLAKLSTIVIDVIIIIILCSIDSGNVDV